MKEIPESLKLEFTMAMRELESEIQKKKQVENQLKQALTGRTWKTPKTTTSNQKN